MEELIKVFDDDLKTAGRAKYTRSSYIGAIRQFAKSVNGNLLGTTKDDLKKYLDSLREQDRRASTVQFHFAALSAFFECMVDNELMATNPITARFRAKFLNQYKAESGTRYCPSTDEVKQFLGSIINTRDLAICIIAFACGLRRNEIRSLDITSVNLEKRTLLLARTPKRTNKRVFFTDECEYCLRRWIQRRKAINVNNSPALFLNRNGGRMSLQGLGEMFRKYARAMGFTGTRIEEKLTIHCARHWATTVLLENGMSLEHVQYIRGDKMSAAIHRYHHPNPEKVKEEYLLAMPSLL